MRVFFLEDTAPRHVGALHVIKRHFFGILKTLEGLLACTSATGIIAFLKDVTADIKDIATKRAEWRARINELEEQFPDLAKGGS